MNRAFTLIELLIVVLIIAILAAIAVPNFLEFQTRAKVSRVKSDMRVMKIGLEAYRVDNNIYPPDNGGQHDDYFNTWTKLTTPIAYLSTIPLSPFDERQFEYSFRNFEYWRGFLDNLDPGSREYEIFYRFTSIGPDEVRQTAPGAAAVKLQNADFWNVIYDPSNGTVSYGEIVAAPTGIF